VIDKDPATFRKLKRVIIMGGSIHRGYGDLGSLPDHEPVPEYNVLMDIPAAKKLFASDVPIYEMPMDSTQNLKLDLVLRNILFSQGTPLTDALTLLYHQWAASTRIPTPTLWDAMAVACAIDPTICPTQPMRIVVDDQGYTRVEPGPANVNVCLHSDSDCFFHVYIPMVLGGNGDRANKLSIQHAILPYFFKTYERRLTKIRAGGYYRREFKDETFHFLNKSQRLLSWPYVLTNWL
jgi:purine nucleosidase